MSLVKKALFSFQVFDVSVAIFVSRVYVDTANSNSSMLLGIFSSVNIFVCNLYLKNYPYSIAYTVRCFRSPRNGRAEHSAVRSKVRDRDKESANHLELHCIESRVERGKSEREIADENDEEEDEKKLKMKTKRRRRR